MQLLLDAVHVVDQHLLLDGQPHGVVADRLGEEPLPRIPDPRGARDHGAMPAGTRPPRGGPRPRGAGGGSGNLSRGRYVLGGLSIDTTTDTTTDTTDTADTTMQLLLLLQVLL